MAVCNAGVWLASDLTSSPPPDAFILLVSITPEFRRRPRPLTRYVVALHERQTTLADCSARAHCKEARWRGCRAFRYAHALIPCAIRISSRCTFTWVKKRRRPAWPLFWHLI